VESHQRILTAYAGVEYDLGPKTLLGLYANSNFNNDDWTTAATTQISNSNSFGYQKLGLGVNDHFDIATPNYNLSLLQKLDTTGGELKLTVGYNHVLEQEKKLISNRFYDNNDQEIAPASSYNTFVDRDFKVFTQKLDFNKKFSRKLSLEAGLKGSYADNYNSSELYFSNTSTGLFVGDTVFYNEYRYRERILAAYATLSKEWKKIGLSLGLRGEQTDINAADLRSAYVLRRSYFNLFPSGSIDFLLNQKNTITMAYSYRIDRPHYGMLNPIRIFNEQLNYSVGNPRLNPQFTHQVTLDYNYNQVLTNSLGFSNAKDFTFYYSYAPAGSKVNVDTIFNFPDMKNVYYSVSAQKRIRWYRFETYGTAIYRTFSGSISGQDVSSETYQLYANLAQEIYLPGEFKIGIWAGMGSDFKDGPQHYYSRSAVHISLNKTFLDNKLNVTLHFNDVFYRDYGSYLTQLPGQSTYYKDLFDTRRVRLWINYRFGKMRIEQRLKTENDSRIKAGK
jgi:hypothetical protein